jgi:hypothetical protein
VRPARQVFEDWGLPLDPANEFAPFDRELVQWLQAGAARLSGELEHRPDHFPLLQHARQAIWDRATMAWKNGIGDASSLIIRCEHLPGVRTAGDRTSAADLKACLDALADNALNEAIEFLKQPPLKLRQDVADVPVCAAFLALAHRDDRRNWARRFADLQLIGEFVRAHLPPADRQRLDWDIEIEKALRIFITAGYLTGGNGKPYDISHEALISNWDRFRRWLLSTDEVAEALVQTATVSLDAQKIKQSGKQVEEMIPVPIAEA